MKLQCAQVMEAVFHQIIVNAKLGTVTLSVMLLEHVQELSLLIQMCVVVMEIVMIKILATVAQSSEVKYVTSQFASLSVETKHLSAVAMEIVCLQTIAVVMMDTLDKNVKLQDLASQ